MKLFKALGWFFRSLWRGLDRLRRGFHLVVMLGFFGIILVLFSTDEDLKIPSSGTLLIAPQGVLVDQLSGDPIERALSGVRGVPTQETLLRDLIDAVRLAKTDGRIKALVLQPEGLTGAGLSKLQELGSEISSFRETGKKVIAIGDQFTRDQYYLAAQADEIFMHPMGAVSLDGYSRYLPYFKSALDKLLVDFNVWVVGDYKSFLEPITRDGMSSADKEATNVFLDALWDAYKTDVAGARGLDLNELQMYSDDALELLEAAGGDTALMALRHGLVDELLTRGQIRERLEGLVQDAMHEEGDFTHVSHEQYLRAVRNKRPYSDSQNSIAIVVASGNILDGTQAPGDIGGDSTSKLIRRATEDERVKALVLRVDSGGGSAFASDVILQELEAFQATERPLVVSMSSVAASGGYWISMSADEIWANRTTITGSIGIGGTFPTFQRSLDRLGIHVDGVGTTKLAGQFNIGREIGPDMDGLFERTVRHGYELFIRKVAEARNRSVDDIDRVAQGRVWVGTDAQEIGLIDKLGQLEDAILSAAQLAGLEADKYEVEYLEMELGLAEQLVLRLTQTMGPMLSVFGTMPSFFSQSLDGFVSIVTEPAKLLERLNDPRDLYAYCFCDVR
mgnify:CR=1 FL=1